MADQNAKNDAPKGLDPNDERLEPNPRQRDNEWLRDQTGEDHNLSGSSTFRNLPDQPDAGGTSTSDTSDRQSNR